MKFPDKLDVLTVQARLISETGGMRGIKTKEYWSLLWPRLRIGIAMSTPML